MSTSSSLNQQQYQTTISLLKQQIQQFHYTVDIKDKKIAYLQSQLKPNKSQQIKKIQILENSFNQLKKENHTFIRKTLQEKQIENEEFENKIRKIYEQNKNKLNQKQQFYQCLLNEKQTQYQSTLKSMQKRYESIISKIKEQNRVLQNLLLQKQQKTESKLQNHQLYSFTNQSYKQYMSLDQQTPSFQYSLQNTNKKDPSNSLFIKQKMSMMQEIITYKKKYQKIKTELQNEKRIFQEIQNQKRNLLIQTQQQRQALNRKIQNLSNKITESKDQNQNQKKIYIQKIIELEEINQNFKNQLKLFNQNYLNALTNRTHANERQIPVKMIKTCNHQGLIKKLQENLQLKNQQVNQLRQRMSQWQKMLGFSKSFDQRLTQIGNISDRTQQIYKNQKDKIKKQALALRKN